MRISDISPDQVVYWQWGPVAISATLVFTWGVMLLLVLGSWLVTRKLSHEDTRIPRWQNLLEILVGGIREQIRQAGQSKPGPFVPFIGTLFLFIAVSNVLMIFPGFMAPTGSLSTTAALAGCVFFAVPIYGISQRGAGTYLRQYIEPTPFMLPFNIIGELSRTLALAVRLFGNIMSGTKIAAILLAVIPFLFPAVMNVLGLLTGLIQAYIFAILAMVYIASANRSQRQPKPEGEITNG